MLQILHNNLHAILFCIVSIVLIKVCLTNQIQTY